MILLLGKLKDIRFTKLKDIKIELLLEDTLLEASLEDL
jgi:hypothetical protein